MTFFGRKDATAVRANDIEPTELTTESVHVRSKSRDYGNEDILGMGGSSSNQGSLRGHGPVEMVAPANAEQHGPVFVDGKRDKFAYFKTKQFWILLGLGQVLSFCVVGTNTLSQLLSLDGVSVPAFQNLFNYVLLTLVWTPITMYKYGIKGWGKMVYSYGWRYIILAFLDVEGNYFTVLGYRYTTILSAQLINFFAIVVVVVMSFTFLHVRYRIPQIIGIVVCIKGMGLLMVSDRLTGANNFPAANQLKGDLFALLGAACYGFSNTFQEFLVSKRPMYEVVGMLSFWAMIIIGVQAAIFDRQSFRDAMWTVKAGGYMAGYDIILFIFYSLAPLVFRLGSAAFFNISLLTGNFWGTVIGIKVFHLHVHWLYPIAFVLIMIGLFIYFIMDGSLGDQFKPWLGENQEQGVSGIGTAKRRIERPETVV